MKETPLNFSESRELDRLERIIEAELAKLKQNRQAVLEAIALKRKRGDTLDANITNLESFLNNCISN
jgi:hypothetical protein